MVTTRESPATPHRSGAALTPADAAAAHGIGIDGVPRVGPGSVVAWRSAHPRADPGTELAQIQRAGAS